ncbi:Speckle-type POZ protein [Hordeum vulgare]|nr:Speckle-type POZ protein [Hordeum vulgare]
MQINTESKGKEVVPPEEQDKGKDVVPPLELTLVQSPPSGKHWNYGHYHDVGGPTNFCKEFKLKTNTGFSWRVTIRLFNDRFTLDQGSSTFSIDSQIKIVFMVTFKLLTSDVLKVIVFNDDGIQVATRCGKHDDAFAVNT